MTQADERRALGVNRVPVSTLVEICGNDPGLPAFEAQSLDVSGRGMHVRTAYLPEMGDPLVCRFENDGREIVVEGRVAWRTERQRGGEFGIQFTALDSGSVDALRDLCGVDDPAKDSAPAPGETKAATESGPGNRVRLHIDGLGAPMKARVRESSAKRVRVGSNLEFLKLGRKLEIEDLEQGQRRGGKIDSVSVAVDPSTQVPELVVTLRYEGVDEITPQPTVVDTRTGRVEPSARRERSRGPVQQQSAETDEFDEFSDDLDAAGESVAEDASLVYDKLHDVAQRAGAVAKLTGASLMRFTSGAAGQLGRAMKGAGAKVGALKKAEPTRKRRTAAPPSGVLSAKGSQVTRSTGVAGARAAAVAPRGSQTRRTAPAAQANLVAVDKKRKQRLIGMACGAGLLLAAASYGVQKFGSDDTEPALSKAVAAQPDAVEPKPGKPLETPSATESGSDHGEVTANVPLFGPTPMATLEPAPLGPAPNSADVEVSERAAAAAAVDDQSWEDSDKKGTADPKAVKPWGRGRMHLPTIHRLRLDAPGADIKGAMRATGFVVVIPGRKVMESGKSIARRDKRIVRVNASNIGAGAKIEFKFRDGVPGYRVRLRQDFVEFLISAPEERQ